MTRRTPPVIIFFATVALWLGSVPTQAQTRVFVAAQGSDSNPCTFAAPCRTFQHAHDVVAANGEIDVLDPAGYGALTITKAISIQGHGFSGISAPSGNGITINAGASDKISLRGLLIDGVGTGANGIQFNTGAFLNVQESLIRNFGGSGIAFISLGGAGNLFVSNTLVSDNAGTGIDAKSGYGDLDHIQAINNGTGISIVSAFIVSDSVVVKGGIVSHPGGAVMVRDCTIRDSLNAVAANGPNAVAWITRSTFYFNSVGISTTSGGQIISFGDNSFAFNSNDGNPTVTIPLK
jgi:hypothetical protein